MLVRANGVSRVLDLAGGERDITKREVLVREGVLGQEAGSPL
jgi:hypothetical protein